MSRIVSRVMNSGHGREADEVNEPESEEKRERSDGSAILRQGSGTCFGQSGGCHVIPRSVPFGRARS